MTALSASIAAVVLAATAATTPTPTPTSPAPPSIAQLCLATGVDEVDDLLADLAATDLVGELSPLATLLVPDSESVEFDASVQLDDIRERLNCAPVDDGDGPGVDPGTDPGDGQDGDTDDDTDDDGFTQVDDLPIGAADTGGGPAA